MTEYNIEDMPNEILEKNELFSSIKEYYIVNKEEIDKNKDSVFSEIKHLITENLIDNIFREYNNSRHKIIETEREKGIIVYIDFFDFEEIYKKQKLSEIYANKSFSAFPLPIYELVKNKIRKIFIKKIIHDKIKKALAEGLDQFHSHVAFLSKAEEKEYVLSEIKELHSLIESVNEIISKVEIYDKGYYRLISNQIREELKNIILNYFDVIPPAQKKELKKQFPSLITFLDGKSLICSYSSNVEDWKLHNLHYNLKRGYFIDDIDRNLFLKIFKNEYITKQINWRKGKSELYFFIVQLLKHGYIATRKDIWKKASHCFTCKHLDIDSKAMSHQKSPCDSKQKEILKIL